jgi:hypothetical protein
MVTAFQLSASENSKTVSLESWLEDCPTLFTKVVRSPIGESYPNTERLESSISLVSTKVRVSDLNTILAEHPQDNIWRSWQLFSDYSCSSSTFVSYVPLFIDIDNMQRDLQKAFRLTKDCLDVLHNKYQYFSSDNLRIVFSGMKGFHIEIKPKEPFDNTILRDKLLNGLIEKGLKYIDATNNFECGVIDPLSHSDIRVTGSLNSWRDNGILKYRRVIQLSLDDFQNSRVEDIILKSETA